MRETAQSAKQPDTDEVAVLVVDDQAQFRAVLREVIARARGFALVGEACSGEEATEAAAVLLPQLVLMDVMMPGIGGSRPRVRC